uniref:Uncharacterized protein n=1 Tax=Peronospora matthiolae TaxID=2874970 RepID=A0AAV1VP72_9STRA
MASSPPALQRPRVRHPPPSARRLASRQRLGVPPRRSAAPQDPRAFVGIPGRAGVTLPDRVSLQDMDRPTERRLPGCLQAAPGFYNMHYDYGHLRSSALPDVGGPQDTANAEAGPGRVASMLPDRVQHGLPQSIGSPAPDGPVAVQDPPDVAARPGRAAEMLPDRGTDGFALAVFTARALGATRGPGDPEDDSSSDRDGRLMDDDAEATTAASDDDRLGQVATELPARAGYTAVATAPPVGMPRYHQRGRVHCSNCLCFFFPTYL